MAKWKNKKLEWFVICEDYDKREIVPYNALTGYLEGIYKAYKKKEIRDRETLSLWLLREFRYRYMSRCEYEVVVKSLFRTIATKKIDVYTQLMLNFDALVDYIIKELELFEKGE